MSRSGSQWVLTRRASGESHCYTNTDDAVSFVIEPHRGDCARGTCIYERSGKRFRGEMSCKYTASRLPFETSPGNMLDLLHHGFAYVCEKRVSPEDDGILDLVFVCPIASIHVREWRPPQDGVSEDMTDIASVFNARVFVEV